MIVRSECGDAGSTKSTTTPGLLAAVQAHDPADALLVDAAAGRRREVHADRGPRSIPALGQELRVDEHVDVAALVGRERRRQCARRRAPADRARTQPGRAHGRGHALGVIDARRVDDSRAMIEAVAVEHRGGHVERLVVERLRQRALVVVAADDRHVAQARAGLDAQRTQRRDDAAPHGVGQREVRHLGGEHVADVLLQQLVGGRHADVDRAAEAPDRRGRALAEGGVGLVADDHAVGVRVDVGRVLDEPGVRLDRDRGLPRETLALLDRADQARAVPLLLEVAHELIDEQAAVGQDEHARRCGRPRRSPPPRRSCRTPSGA